MCTAYSFPVVDILDKVYFLYFFLFLDPFGKRDERGLLTHAVQSDSTVIGGNLSSLQKAGNITMTLFSEESCLELSLPMIIHHPESSTLCLPLSLFMHRVRLKETLFLCQELCGFILPRIQQGAKFSTNSWHIY